MSPPNDNEWLQLTVAILTIAQCAVHASCSLDSFAAQLLPHSLRRTGVTGRAASS